jgi:16S rRNA processing protein RimM
VNAGERLVVGRVRGIHGLRGAVRVESLTDRPHSRFAVGGMLFVEGSDSPLTIVEARQEGPGWRLRFAEIPDRTAAEELRDAYLEGVVGPGQELPAGEYYWHQLVGATVREVGGDVLGQVTDVYRAGGAEVVVVAGAAGEVDVPLVRAVVRDFAPERGEIVVDGRALGWHGEAGQPETADRAGGSGP